MRVALCFFALATLIAGSARAEEKSKADAPKTWCAPEVNELSDPDVVSALRRAAAAGVPVDLIVRGVCTLRPDAAHPNLRIVSVVGRFVEHSRIYRFANDGAPEHLIGSADLRARDLRQHIELLAPVEHAEHRAQLDAILATYLADGGRWVLDADGRYVRATDAGAIAQEALGR